MLCDACWEYFTFGRPDALLSQKKVAIQEAVDQGFEVSHIKNLESDYKRYRDALEQPSVATQFPCPWNTGDPFEVPFSVDESFSLGKARSWREIQDSATSFGCDLCERLAAMTKKHTIAEVDGDAVIISIWFMKRGSHTPLWLRFDLRLGGATIFMMRFHSAVEDVDEIETSVLRLNAPKGTSTMDETCMKFLSESLALCLSKHKRCSLEYGNWIPTRLLDVLRDYTKHDSIRIVERKDVEATAADTRVKYITLSHLWGSAHQLKLTRPNYNDMMKAITIGSLPQCFLDAVSITRRLGIRYLWIDSLCIIQDSPQDWAAEAATMAKVYRNGICNIAACNATNSSRSLFVQRNPTVGGSFTVSRKYTDQTVKFTLIPDWVNLTWNTAPLYHRGWAIQERFLSTRVMHFTEFPFWECSTTLTTEVYTTHLKPKILCFPSLPRTQRQWLSSTNDVESSVWLWWRLIKIYTKCSLTVKTDKLIALSGMAETFSKLVNEPYLARIWGGKYLLFGLLWRVEKGSPREELGSAEYRAPSWSWASRDGAVSLYPHRKILGPLVQVISAYTALKSNNPFGQLLGGELVFKGFLFVVSTGKRQKDLKFPGEMHFDHQTLEPLDEDIYFLPLAELSPQSQSEERRGERSFTGIFLQERKYPGIVGSRMFNRIGDCYVMRGGGDRFVLDIPS